MKNIKRLTLILIIAMSSTLFAKVGTEGGGGGDASELRVYEIRDNLYRWINQNGFEDIILYEIDEKIYKSKMIGILWELAVKVEFVEEEIVINNEIKNCKSFYSEIDNNPNIICNIARFKKMSDSEQYQLIHHQYASLVQIEKNEGSESDYKISVQIAVLPTSQIKRLLILENEMKDFQKPHFNCKVVIDGLVAFNGKKYLMNAPLEKQSIDYGYAQLVSNGDVKVYVINQPLRIVASFEYIPGVPTKVKTSIAKKSKKLPTNKVEMNTNLGGYKIKAECIENVFNSHN